MYVAIVAPVMQAMLLVFIKIIGDIKTHVDKMFIIAQNSQKKT